MWVYEKEGYLWEGKTSAEKTWWHDPSHVVVVVVVVVVAVQIRCWWKGCVTEKRHRHSSSVLKDAGEGIVVVCQFYVDEEVSGRGVAPADSPTGPTLIRGQRPRQFGNI